MANKDETVNVNMTTRSLLSWSLYAALVAFRVVVGPSLFGYVHPDELFQSGQEIWYGHPPLIAWEFEPNNALRSMLPPGIMTGMPLQVYGLLTGNGEPSGNQVLRIPRLACSVLSMLTVDWSLWRVLKATKTKSLSSLVPLSMLLLASSWPTMVLLNRPFSNSLETCMVALLVAAVLDTRKTITIRRCLYIGMICALGLFTRFTFCFFAIPPMLLFLYDLLVLEQSKMSAIKKILATTLAFLLVSITIVSADTIFYSSDYFANKISWNSLSIKDVVVTPWNALRYNSKVSNLQEHGLHPRWTHALVNMWILFGPLTLLAYWKILGALRSQPPLDRTTQLACWMVVSGLGFLSLAPHQEPRFLLPLLVPLVLLARSFDAIWKDRRSLKLLVAAVWIVFNLILFMLFGVLHQSGVVPSLLDLGRVLQNQQPLAIFYYHTYMPPSFLLRTGQSTSDKNCADGNQGEGYCGALGTFGKLVDLKGSDWATLENALGTHLECETKSSHDEFVILVMPTMMQQDESSQASWSFTPDTCQIPSSSYDCGLLPSYGNHLSTEDLPPFGGSTSQFYRNMALNVYEISCSSR